MRAELDRNYKANLGDAPQKPFPEEADIRRLTILHQMIQDEILQQRAAKLNLAASDEDVNAKITELKTPYTQDEFDNQLKARDMTLDDLKRNIRRSLTQDKLINKEIESRVNVTDAEISAYYAAHKADFNLIEPRYQLAQIAVTTPTRAAARQFCKQQGLRRRRRPQENSDPAQPPRKRRRFQLPGHELL